MEKQNLNFTTAPLHRQDKPLYNLIRELIDTIRAENGGNIMDGVKEYLKNEALKWRFEFAKSIRRKKAPWLVDTADYYFPHMIRSLYFGSGKKQFLEEKERYFGDNYK